jgi:hypothetical protein
MGTPLRSSTRTSSSSMSLSLRMALQSKSLYDSQNYATAVYQSHLTYQLAIWAMRSRAEERSARDQGLLSGVRGGLKSALSGHPGADGEIRAERTRSSSDRRPQHARAETGAFSAEVLASNYALAAEYGNRAEKVISEARARVERQARKPEDLLGKAREPECE